MNERRPLDAVVLAAGKGTRMKSDLAKVLHELDGRPLLAHVLDAARAAGVERTVVVVGHQADRVRERVDAPDLEFVVQQPQLGTGHAVMVAAPALRDGGWTVVLAGDVPLLTVATLRALIEQTGAACVFSEPQFQPRVIEAVVEGTQARKGVLDPVGAELTPGPDLYPELLRMMGRSLVDCLG